MTKKSVIFRDFSTEKTFFEFFYDDESKDPFMEVEYDGLVSLIEGDHVNVIPEKDSEEYRLMGQDIGACSLPLFSSFPPPTEYIVKNSKEKGRVNLGLMIGGENNGVQRYYTLVRIERKN